MKYSRFKGTLYVVQGSSASKNSYVEIVADGHSIYRSPEMSKISKPVNIDVNVTGYNDVKIKVIRDGQFAADLGPYLCLADAGFYQ